ncbi:hypothetical protein [Neisseria wadsworthii]|uniref:Lipoprotein n=1 Tax=Neisseria wadsworthii 9715 TaxID=1030841 RepID=G4CLW3_9NEIS|nr:hypothetical protein [Neisseria wadsworthii]EGZ51321.1 hypothetical protein HMPREF9370_0072 [Neisseria wadsworthii 9715]QMT36144.1 hypothetical protein H3L96_02560 [Neisseria wadsworthii]
MRKLTLIIVAAFSLCACKPGALEGGTDLLSAGAKLFKIFGKKADKSAPQASELGLDKHDLAALATPPANPQPVFTFTPTQKQVIIYFGKDAEQKPGPSPDGYYRVVKGQTADGRWVVQDFYQNNKAPQTNVFVIKRGGDVNDFDSAMGDSHLVWFQPDGLVNMQGKYEDGVWQGIGAFYTDNKLSAYIRDFSTDKIDLVTTYPQGTIKSRIVMDFPNQTQTHTLYYTDGGGMAKIVFNVQDQKPVSMQAWDKEGYEIAAGDIKEQIVGLLEEDDKLLQDFQQKVTS